jgi:hypothetical protein
MWAGTSYALLENALSKEIAMSAMQEGIRSEAKQVVGSVPEAENLLVTDDERWFVSGSDGLYQVEARGGTSPQKIPLAFDADHPPSIADRSFFFGITQYRNFVYAICTPNLKDAASPRYLMLMDTEQSRASMVAIHRMSNASFFNGLGSDGHGNLYLADFGKVFPPAPGKLVKLTLSSPATVSGQSDWLASVDGHPNGVKICRDILYFSQEPVYFVGDSHIKKVRIKVDGTADAPGTLYTAGIGKLLDDIEPVEDGLVITQASLLNSFNPALFHQSHINKIIHIDESGEERHSTHISLAPPSAVRLASNSTVSPDSPDLIITERTGEVSRLSQSWGLKPRR